MHRYMTPGVSQRISCMCAIKPQILVSTAMVSHDLFSNVLLISLFSVVYNCSYHKTLKFIIHNVINDNNIITCCFRGYRSMERNCFQIPEDTLRFSTGLVTTWINRWATGYVCIAQCICRTSRVKRINDLPYDVLLNIALKYANYTIFDEIFRIRKSFVEHRNLEQCHCNRFPKNAIVQCIVFNRTFCIEYCGHRKL